MTGFLDDLRGKAVLITGASTGIGAAAAKAFGACGARVAVHCNQSRDAAEGVASSVREAGGEAIVVAGDLSATEAVRRVVAETLAGLGDLDILINNAGGLVRRAPADTVDDDLFQAIVDLNIRSAVMASREVLPHFTARGRGVIIMTGSIAARHGGGPGAGIYASAKGFLHTYTRHLAKDFAGRGVRVNAVSPGVILTPFHKDTPQEAIEGWEKAIPMGRCGTPDDTVGAFLFLASDRLSGYVTGQVIDVNGGFVMPG